MLQVTDYSGSTTPKKPFIRRVFWKQTSRVFHFNGIRFNNAFYTFPLVCGKLSSPQRKSSWAYWKCLTVTNFSAVFTLCKATSDPLVHTFDIPALEFVIYISRPWNNLNLHQAQSSMTPRQLCSQSSPFTWAQLLRHQRKQPVNKSETDLSLWSQSTVRDFWHFRNYFFLWLELFEQKTNCDIFPERAVS